MIRVRRRGLSLTISGHAGAGQPGRDLVCAAVSALAWTLGANLEELERSGAAAQVFIRMAPGDCRFRLVPSPGREEEGRGVFRVVCLGLKGLARQHSRYLTWEEE